MFTTNSSAIAERHVQYQAAGRRFDGLLIEPPGQTGAPRAAVLVLHGGAGSTEHERQRARMLAELGYVALVPDLFGEVFTSREQGIAVISALAADPPALRARLACALGFMADWPGVDRSRLAAVGFCFGGHAALELARSGAPLRAAVSIHGGLTSRAPAAARAVHASILVCTGAADPFVTREHRTAFEEEMTAAGADWQLHVYSGAMHGFSERPTAGRPARPGVGYHEAADARSWAAARDLLRQTLTASSAVP